MKPLSNSEYRQIAATVQRVAEMPRRVDSLPPGLQPQPAVTQVCRFQLKDDLELGDDGADGDADAYMLYRIYDNTLETYGDLTVDWDNVIRVAGYNGWTGAEGDRGICVHLHDTDMWDVIGGGATFKQCKCQLTADLATSAGTPEVDNVVPTHGSSPLDDPTDMTETLTVQNVFSFDSDDDGLCLIEYWPNMDYWVLIYAPCAT